MNPDSKIASQTARPDNVIFINSANAILMDTADK